MLRGGANLDLKAHSDSYGFVKVRHPFHGGRDNEVTGVVVPQLLRRLRRGIDPDNQRVWDRLSQVYGWRGSRAIEQQCKAIRPGSHAWRPRPRVLLNVEIGVRLEHEKCCRHSHTALDQRRWEWRVEINRGVRLDGCHVRPECRWQSLTGGVDPGLVSIR